MLRLRPYKACDAKIIVSWIKDEIFFRKWCADRYEKYPITKEDMNKMYDSMSYNDDFFQMTAFDENGVVGHLIMRFTDSEKKVTRFGFVIVDDSKRGKGYGKEMLHLAIKYAFEILKSERITLGVFENNESAYYCYKSLGFKETQVDNIKPFRVFDENWICKELELLR